MKKLTVAVLLLISAMCFAQGPTPKPPASFDGLSFLLGDWTGGGAGEPGKGSGGFSLKPDLNGFILVRRSHSEYPSNGGRVLKHDDWMNIFEENGKLKALYIDTEGHVIHYAVSAEKDSATFLSEGDGPRFRLSYRQLKPGDVTIKFEMAPPGTDAFKTYVEGSATRN